MRARTTAAALLVAGLALAGCGGGGSDSKTASKAPDGKPLTVATAFDAVAKQVTTAKFSDTVSAANDKNHLLGRPNEYTSKTDFTDSRIKADDVSGLDRGDVERGGAIEVFPAAADAKARATYIQTVTKSLPVFAEYDYQQGNVLVRVSHFLTPDQAGEYKAAAGKL